VSLYGFRAQQVMSPSSWLTLNNLSKIPAICISMLLFGGELSGLNVGKVLPLPTTLGKRKRTCARKKAAELPSANTVLVDRSSKHCPLTNFVPEMAETHRCPNCPLPPPSALQILSALMSSL
jgi:hypothetical protein